MLLYDKANNKNKAIILNCAYDKHFSNIAFPVISHLKKFDLNPDNESQVNPLRRFYYVNFLKPFGQFYKWIALCRQYYTIGKKVEFSIKKNFTIRVRKWFLYAIILHY